MSKNIAPCEDCPDEFCADCFQLTPCDVCQKTVCEDCFDKAEECPDCGSRNCDDCGHKCTEKKRPERK
jgi:hypothetical protein